MKKRISHLRELACYDARVIESENFISLRASRAGFLESLVNAGDSVEKDQVLAYITDPYTSEVLQEVAAPEDGIIAFEYDSPLAYQNTALFKLIPDHKM